MADFAIVALRLVSASAWRSSSKPLRSPSDIACDVANWRMTPISDIMPT